MIFAISVPLVIKFATIFPSAVIAVSYGPLYPLFEKPKPPTFHRHTFLASYRFSLSRIKSSYGLPVTESVCITTKPPC